MKLGGRYSKACLDCRIRRIKCDLEVPACSQCLRAKKKCQGYRSVESLMFRDGTPSISQLAYGLDKSSRFGRPMVKSPRSTPSSDGDVQSTQDGGDLVVSRSLPAPSLDRGIEYFYDHYVTFVSDKPAGRAALPSSLAWNHLFTNTAFHDACSAAGYAGLHNITRDHQYMVLARKQYARSITNIQANMDDSSKHATTMMSALILAVFEVVSAGAWNVHLSGGITLWRMMVAMGRPPPPRTQLYHVFFMVNRAIIRQIGWLLTFRECIYRLLAGKAIEHTEVGWILEIQKQLHHDDAHAAPLALLTARVVSLYASLQDQRPNTESLLLECHAVNEELENWENNLSPQWHFTTRMATNTNHAYHNTTHQYQDFWLARMLMNYRWTRIIISHLILLNSSYSQDLPQNYRHIEIIRRLSLDICHSVPYFLEPSVVEMSQTTPFPIFAGCFVIIFPLAVVGCAIGVGDETQSFAIRILQMLGDKLGISGATTMIDRVRLLRQQWQKLASIPQENQ